MSPIVDVGGGIGTLEMTLLKSERNSGLEFILFDSPGTIENARKVGQLTCSSGTARSYSLIQVLGQPRPGHLQTHHIRQRRLYGAHLGRI